MNNFIIGITVLLLVFFWFNTVNHRDQVRSEYNDCVMEQMEGTSVPLQDAWVIFNDVCQN